MTIEETKKDYLKLLKKFTDKTDYIFILERNIRIIKERIKTLESIYISYTEFGTFYSDEFMEQVSKEKERLCIESSALEQASKEKERLCIESSALRSLLRDLQQTNN